MTNLIQSKNITKNIFFHILTKCNLKCKHCYIDPKEHGNNSLDIDTINSWLTLFLKKHTKSTIIFLGGEPTLHPKLHLAVKKAKKLGYTSVTIDTNGYLFNNILSNIELNDVNSFSFSLDGPTKDSNDLLRGNGSYKECIKNISKVKKKGFNVDVITTISQSNIKYLNKMPNLLYSLGVDRFLIQVIGIRGTWTKNLQTKDLLKQVNKKLWLETIPLIAEHTATLGITTTYPKVFLKPNETFKCTGLTGNNYFIFPNGRIYHCPLCSNYPIHSKIIKNNTLIKNQGITEADLFKLEIPDGCVMNKIIQPNNINHNKNNLKKHKISCCMCKKTINPKKIQNKNFSKNNLT